MSITDKNRKTYLDIIKILAILFVLFNHSHWYITSNNKYIFYIHSLLFYLCKMAVPLFIMSSGALLLKKEMSYRQIFLKRIIRILIPLLIVTSLCYFFSSASIKDFIGTLFFNYDKMSFSPYWLWYLYMLIGLYLVTPFIYKMINNFSKRDYIVFIGLFVFLFGLIKMIPIISNIVLGNALTINSSFVVNFFSINIGYYVLGYFLDNKNISKNNVKVSLIILIISIILGSLFVSYGINEKKLWYDNLVTYDLVSVAIPTTCVFIIIKYYVSKYIIDNDFTIKIKKISNSVFGIYLFHPFIISLIYNSKYLDGIININTLYGVLLIDLFVFVALFIFVYYLRKINFLKKIL